MLLANDGLVRPDVATTVRVRGGETQITCGPSVEAGDYLAGYRMIGPRPGGRAVRRDRLCRVWARVDQPADAETLLGAVTATLALLGLSDAQARGAGCARATRGRENADVTYQEERPDRQGPGNGSAPGDGGADGRRGGRGCG